METRKGRHPAQAKGGNTQEREEPKLEVLGKQRTTSSTNTNDEAVRNVLNGGLNWIQSRQSLNACTSFATER